MSLVNNLIDKSSNCPGKYKMLLYGKETDLIHVAAGEITSQQVNGYGTDFGTV